MCMREIKNQIHNLSKEQIISAIDSCNSCYKILEHLNVSKNGKNMAALYRIAAKIGKKLPRFERQIVYPKIKKKCPVCKEEFETQAGSKKEKTVCSRSCANSYYRSGTKHPNHINSKKQSYRMICFEVHEKICCVCGFDKVVHVHHLDNNRDNNKKENLVPLCPNHHAMIHNKKFKAILTREIENYLVRLPPD